MFCGHCMDEPCKCEEKITSKDNIIYALDVCKRCSKKDQREPKDYAAGLCYNSFFDKQSMEFITTSCIGKLNYDNTPIFSEQIRTSIEAELKKYNSFEYKK